MAALLPMSAFGLKPTQHNTDAPKNAGIKKAGIAAGLFAILGAGNGTATGFPTSTAWAPFGCRIGDVPMRPQFVHSTVASAVHCDVSRWREPVRSSAIET